MLWQVHEHHIAKSDFPQFPDALTTTGQSQETAILKWSLHLTSTIQTTQKLFKFAPGIPERYDNKWLDFMILQLERLDDIWGMNRCKHHENNRLVGASPKHIMTEVVDRDIVSCKRADVCKRKQLIEGDGWINVPSEYDDWLVKFLKIMSEPNDIPTSILIKKLQSTLRKFRRATINQESGRAKFSPHIHLCRNNGKGITK